MLHNCVSSHVKFSLPFLIQSSPENNCYCSVPKFSWKHKADGKKFQCHKFNLSNFFMLLLSWLVSRNCAIKYKKNEETDLHVTAFKNEMLSVVLLEKDLV